MNILQNSFSAIKNQFQEGFSPLLLKPMKVAEEIKILSVTTLIFVLMGLLIYTRHWRRQRQVDRYSNDSSSYVTQQVANNHFNQLSIPPMPEIDYRTFFNQLSHKTSEEATQPYDLINCRFTNILCPKDTLVEVQGKTDKLYLHANHVRLARSHVIVTQYPKPEQLTLFWRACQNASLILDLTNDGDMKKSVKQGDMEKSLLVPYTPTSAHPVLQDKYVKVTYEKEQAIEGIQATFYHYHVEENNSDMKPFQIKRLHYKGWDDHAGISKDDLDQLMNLLEPYQSDSTRPVIIHCHAGVGRSGTISVVNALHGLIQNKKTDANKLLKHTEFLILEGRKQRGPGFVQTSEQLKAIVNWGWRAVHRSTVSESHT